MELRELYWNIPPHLHWLIYPMFVVVLVSFCYVFYQRYRLWKLGQPENRRQDVRAGIKDVLVYRLGHKRIVKESYAGLMHLTILWGFIF